ncbi:MAG: DUF2442 domain-containing protein [Myxococcota bacterium]
MSTSAPEYPRAVDLSFDDDMLVVRLEDGRELRVPIEWYPSLRDATVEQRQRWEFIGGGVGVHWPDLDEDLSIRGMLTPHMTRGARPHTA